MSSVRGLVVTEAILDVQDLQVYFPVFKGFVQRLLGGSGLNVHAVDGVTFSVPRGSVLGLVGESGCGKTTVARALIGLAKPTAGRITFEGKDVTARSREDLVRLRQRIQVVYQDPHGALNPAMTIGEAIGDVVRTHGIVQEDGERVPARSDAEVRVEVLRVLDDVGLRPPGFVHDKYPRELSGGQKQRAVLARVLALRPRLVIADEPVAMLDMSVRARILQLMLDLQSRYGLTYLFITHDLATAKFMCDEIAIMYLGRIVEMGPAKDIYADPKHPYTRALLQAIPVPDPERRSEKVLPAGEVPDAIHPPGGCRFHPRCPVALPTCGWEGRDFLAFLEERRLDPAREKEEAEALGDLEEWRSEGLDGIRKVRPDETAALRARVEAILADASEPMRRAVVGVRGDERAVVVTFRPPDPLAPKNVDGRLVECLLY